MPTAQCPARRRWPLHLTESYPAGVRPAWWSEQNYLDAYSRRSRGGLPADFRYRFSACLNLRQLERSLGPHVVSLFAGMTIEEGARVCVRLQGDRRGVDLRRAAVLMRGIEMRTHNEQARPFAVLIERGLPLVQTEYTRRWFFFIPVHHDILFMNPLVKFRNKIPTHYDPDTKQLFSETHVNGARAQSRLQRLPVLYDAVRRGRLPAHLRYEHLAALLKALSGSWMKEQEPDGIRERIKRQTTSDVVAGLGESLAWTGGKLTTYLDELKFPGLYVAMNPATKFTAEFTSAKVGQKPISLDMHATIDMKRLFLSGIVDLRDGRASLSSKLTITDRGLDVAVHLPAIEARLNPVRYGPKNPTLPATVQTLGGRIKANGVCDELPSGIHVVRTARGDVSITLNMALTHRLRTANGTFTVNGDIAASMKGRWTPGAAPRIAVGGTHIEIKNVTVTKKGETQPLIAGARLVITDDPNEKKLLLAAHPTFTVGSSGMLVRLELNDLHGLGYQSGYAAGFIPLPRGPGGAYYHPRRFSLQETLNLAFGLISEKNAAETKGRIAVSRLSSLRYGGNVLTGRGIRIAGHAVSISRNRVKHLVKHGSIKLLSRWERSGDGGVTRRWYALVAADAVRLPDRVLYTPALRLRARAENGARGRGVVIEQLRATLPRARFGPARLDGGTVTVSGARILYRNGRLDARIRRLRARFQRFFSPALSIGAPDHRGSVALKGRIIYDRYRKTIAIRGLGARFMLPRIAPRGLRRATRGRITSVDIDGYLGGRWKHDLRTKRGRGWLQLSGDKEGDVHLRDRRGRRRGSARLGRETPLFSDTRWIALRIDGVDRRGWLKGQFCLRTDVDPLAVPGVGHAGYVEWTMGHDNIALTRGIGARAAKYYRDLKRGVQLPKGSRRLGIICRRVLRGKDR